MSCLKVHHAVFCIALSLVASPVLAADWFGGLHLFGQRPSEPAKGLRYKVELVVDGNEDDLRQVISESSLLITQADLGAADGFGLISRARADIEQLRAALYAEARYAETVEISLNGHPAENATPEDIAVPARDDVSIVIHVQPGPVFRFGAVVLEQTRRTETRPQITSADLKLQPGAEAQSGLIVTAIDQLVDAWRREGYPFARIVKKDISADHARQTLDVRLVVDPGRAAVIGNVEVVGTRAYDARMILSQSALKPGERFDVEQLRQARERLRKLDGVESVRVIEGDHLDKTGGLPITLEVQERKPRYFGGTASASSKDGAEISAYWGHRNLFGKGEELKLYAGVSQIGANDLDNAEFKTGWEYTVPGFIDIDTNLFNEFNVERSAPDPYEAFSARLKTGLSHRFDKQRKASIAFEVEQMRVMDAFGTSDHTLLSIPVELVRDTRDSQLDPTSGTNTMLRFAPVADVARSDAFAIADVQFSAYRPLDENNHFVLAGRTAAGSITGASLKDVPATYRYFAGGGGSVRGFGYRSLSPLLDGERAGGLGYVASSLELRMRLTQKIGLVPFVDLATVSTSSLADFADEPYVGGGLGLRYYTTLGPIRLDVALPLTHRDEQSDVAFYVGLGQAF